MDIGTRLRSIRKSKELSVYRLADLTDISQNHIHRIEKGQSETTIPTLEKLLKPLGVSFSEFFSDSFDVLYVSEDERELVQEFRRLNDARKETILRLIHQLAE